MKNEKSGNKKTAVKENQKPKKGKYRCDFCGKVITVDDSCGCGCSGVVCCGQDMRCV